MADKKRDTIRFITPRGVAIYPKLHKPDTKFKPQGEYSVKLRLAADAGPFYIGKTQASLDELKEQLGGLLDRMFDETKSRLASGDGKQKAKAKKLERRSIDDIFAAHVDDEGEETGDYVVKGHMLASGKSKKDGKKWTRAPSVFDAKRKPLKPVPAIFGGSELKLGLEAVGYYAPNDNIVGITFYLDGVQVLKLVKGGERDAASMGFGEEEGYSGADDEETEFPADDDEDGDDDEAGDDDEDGDDADF